MTGHRRSKGESCQNAFPPLRPGQARELLQYGLPPVNPAVDCTEQEELEEFIYNERNLEQPAWRKGHQGANVGEREFISEASAAMNFTDRAVPRRRQRGQYPQISEDGLATSSTYRPIRIDALLPARPDRRHFHDNVNPYDVADEADPGDDALPPGPEGP